MKIKFYEATANAVVSFCMKNFYDSYIFVIYHFFTMLAVS